MSLLLILALASVRAEPVEGRAPSAASLARPSTGSGRTEEGERAFDQKGGKARDPQTALDAERAFAADAKRIGQWTAFRRWATADATMFAPDPVLAQNWLKDRPDPPRAVQWSPTRSYVSCDGAMAVNTGEWRLPDGSAGYFTTVWVRQADGQWRWILDHGDTLTEPRARVASPVVRRASCAGRPTSPLGSFPQYRWAGLSSGGRIATNGTLAYHYHANGGGQRSVMVVLWTGERWERVISDAVATAPGP